ncbi:MAG: PLP-dependent aminotransferase family protein [Granulosicoccus sp.]|nr:PLP-dependent aminotransferase family protein [Granulosicoccus sp.]
MTELAQRIKRLQPSPIRDILHVIDQPGMISFAGGLPSGDSFPELPIGELSGEQLQYGPSEGEPALREHIASDLTARGLPTEASQVLILSGSQQGIDLVAKLLINEGTKVAVESPTYLAALQVFTLLGADYQPLALQSAQHEKDDGSLNTQNTALTYAIPTFQNPTGHCYSLNERQALASACDQTGSILFEDDPYRELCFDPCDRTPVCSLLKTTPWIYQSSFSKTLAPGLRLGYMTSSPELFPHLVRLKQAADLHSNRVSQHLVLKLLQADTDGSRLSAVIERYRQKRDHFEQLLKYHFNDIATWEKPAGGLFFWLNLKLNEAVDSRKLLPEAIRNHVAFMPGEPFYPGTVETANAIRLNFSHASQDNAEIGLKTLASLFKRFA